VLSSIELELVNNTDNNKLKGSDDGYITLGIAGFLEFFHCSEELCSERGSDSVLIFLFPPFDVS
jgi:hypothetical protein